MADVGACFQALLDQPTIRRRLAKSGGRDDLDEITVSRLSILAALHDIGKVNVGFQARIWRHEDMPKGIRRLPKRTGHTSELVPVLTSNDRRTADWFFDSLSWWWDAIETWDDREGETVCALLVATISHHGRPIQLEGGRQPNPEAWQTFGQLDPRKFVKRIGRLLKEWFPNAFLATEMPLPSTPEFQHFFLGLCNWADWMGSDETYFNYCDQPREDYFHIAKQRAKRAISELGLNVSKQRQTLSTMPDFPSLFPQIDGPPNAIQRAIHEISQDMQLVARGMVRGEGGTAGYHERIIPLRYGTLQIFGRSGGKEELDDLARKRVEHIETVEGILRHALTVFAAGGNTTNIADEHRSRANKWTNKLDEIVDGDFFEDLQEEFNAFDKEHVHNEWLREVVGSACALLRLAMDSLPCPSIHKYRASAEAKRLFENRIRQGLPFLFTDEDEESKQ